MPEIMEAAGPVGLEESELKAGVSVSDLDGVQPVTLQKRAASS